MEIEINDLEKFKARCKKNMGLKEVTRLWNYADRKINSEKYFEILVREQRFAFRTKNANDINFTY